MSRLFPPSCPICDYPAPHRALFGPFPVWLCFSCDEESPVVYGFWSRPTFWMASITPSPTDGAGNPGWSFLCYEGSYLPALWALVMGRVK